MAAAVVAQQQQEEEQKRAQHNQMQLEVVSSLPGINNNPRGEDDEDTGELSCYEDATDLSKEGTMMTQAQPEQSGVS